MKLTKKKNPIYLQLVPHFLTFSTTKYLINIQCHIYYQSLPQLLTSLLQHLLTQSTTLTNIQYPTY